MEGRKARRRSAARFITATLDPTECATFSVAAQALATETAAIEIQFTSEGSSMSNTDRNYSTHFSSSVAYFRFFTGDFLQQTVAWPKLRLPLCHSDVPILNSLEQECGG